MADEILDGFDHAQYEQEVTERWGQEAYQRSDGWWRSLSQEQRDAFKKQGADVAREFAAARDAGEPVDGGVAQGLARRQVEWLKLSTDVSREYVVNLGGMYVADPRFGRNYAPAGVDPTPYAEYVRDALKVYAEQNLPA